MGSIDAACISGFLCRLCSEMHRTVIHIYGDQGQKYDLAGKINAYLPVTVSPNVICKNKSHSKPSHKIKIPISFKLFLIKSFFSLSFSPFSLSLSLPLSFYSSIVIDSLPNRSNRAIHSQKLYVNRA